MKLKVFTVESGKVSQGAEVEKLELKGAEVTIPAVFVGERGRGRELGVLPVQLLPEQYEIWKKDEPVTVNFAEVGSTKAGKPKLFEAEQADTNEEILVVFRTKIGYRGSNNHTGDQFEEYYTIHLWPDETLEKARQAGIEIKDTYTKQEAISNSAKIYPGEDRFAFERNITYNPFPGKTIVEGWIAEGAAGRAGGGKQLIAIMPKDTVFRTSYGGRLYGDPREHFYLWNGEKLLAITRDEREATDLF